MRTVSVYRSYCDCVGTACIGPPVHKYQVEWEFRWMAIIKIFRVAGWLRL